MKKSYAPLWLTLACSALFWAYVVIDDLLRSFNAKATLIDLLAVLVLGLIAGLGLGLSLAVHPFHKETNRGE